TGTTSATARAVERMRRFTGAPVWLIQSPTIGNASGHPQAPTVMAAARLVAATLGDVVIGPPRPAGTIDPQSVVTARLSMSDTAAPPLSASPPLPSTMKALVKREAGKGIWMEDVAVPRAGANEV